MRQTRWTVNAVVAAVLLRCGLFVELLPLDYHLDIIFLDASLVIVAPPGRPLVIALQSQVFTGRTTRRAFVALLSS